LLYAQLEQWARFEAKSSVNPARQIVWVAVRMAVFAFVAGMYVSVPLWEERNSFNRKWGIIMAAFFTSVTVAQAVGLRRQLKKFFETAN